MAKRDTDSVDSVAVPSPAEIAELLDGVELRGEGNLIGILQEIQDRLGYLDADALLALSRRERIPLSRIYGVVSFYAQFHTAPRGRHTILCCRGTACHVRGASGVLDVVKRALGIDEDQSTPDLRYYLETVACLGTCFLAPVMMIDERYFGKLTPQGVEAILENYGTDE